MTAHRRIISPARLPAWRKIRALSAEGDFVHSFNGHCLRRFAVDESFRIIRRRLGRVGLRPLLLRSRWPQSTLHLMSMGRAWMTTAYSDRKSTRLNSSHANISYAVFC